MSRWAHLSATVLVVILLLFPAWITLADPVDPPDSEHLEVPVEQPSRANQWHLAPTPISSPAAVDQTPARFIDLQYARFDPLEGEPPLVDPLRSGPQSPLFLFQVFRPLNMDQTAVIESLGIELVGWIPDGTWIAFGDPALGDIIRGFDFVRWVGPYHLGYRIDLRFMDELVSSADANLSLEFEAVILGDHHEIERRGGELDFWSTNTYATGIAPASVLLDLAEEGHILHLAPKPILKPILDVTREISRVEEVWTNFDSGLNGTGQMITVADVGIDDDHGDFPNIDQIWDVWGDGHEDPCTGHGTHVAGIAAGNGVRDSRYIGMAPGATLTFQALSRNSDCAIGGNLDSLIPQAANYGARVHTNSYGVWGAQGAYLANSAQADSWTYDFDKPGGNGFMLLFGMGNEGPTEQTGIAPGTAKNVVTVGGSRNLLSSMDQVAGGSSRGPAADGRIKPDLLTPGWSIRAPRSQDYSTNGWYVNKGGTSMATPGAAGLAVLIRQYMNEQLDLTEPSGALVKALMIHGAVDMGTRDIPNMDEGWGRMDLENTLYPAGREVFLDDRRGVTQDEQYQYTVNITAGEPLKVTVVWSDPEAQGMSNRTLVNDLNLEVEAPDGTIYLGNNFSNGQSTTGNGTDRLNNVEQFLLDNPQTGTWLVRVIGFGINLGGIQHYALVVSGDVDPMPDIEVGYLTFNPDPVLASLPTTLTATVVNNGALAVPGFDIHFSDLQGWEQWQTASVGADSTVDVAVTWTAPRGLQLISVEVDPNGTVFERSEQNNLYSELVDVVSYHVELFPDVTEFTLDYPENSYDLFVVARNSGSFDENVTVSVGTITATSGGDPTGWVAQTNLSGFALPRLVYPNFWMNLTTPTPPVAGIYTIPLIATVTEDTSVFHVSNITVYVTRLIDLDISTDLVDPYLVSPGQQVEMNLTLTNNGNTGGPLKWSFLSGSWPAEVDTGSGFQPLVSGVIPDLRHGDMFSLAGRVLVPAISQGFPPPGFLQWSGLFAEDPSDPLVNHSGGSYLEMNSVPGVGLNASVTQLSLAAGEMGVFEVGLENAGNIDDLLHLDIINPDNLPFSLRNASRAIPNSVDAGDVLTFELEITSLGDAGDQHAITLTAQTDTAPVASTTLDLLVSVPSVNEFQISSSSDNASGSPLEPVDFDLLITNSGNNPDLISLVGTSGQGWPVVLEHNSVDLDLVSSVGVQVTPPVDVVDGTVDTVHIEATSENGSQVETLDFTITVAIQRGIGLLAQLEELEAPAGTSAELVFDLQNPGTGEDIFDLSLDAGDWDVEFSDPSYESGLQVRSGYTGLVRVTVTFPDEGEDQVLELSAQSRGDSALSTSASVTLMIEGSGILAAATEGSQSGLIIGGIIGFLVLVAIMVVVMFVMNKRTAAAKAEYKKEEKQRRRRERREKRKEEALAQGYSLEEFREMERERRKNQKASRDAGGEVAADDVYAWDTGDEDWGEWDDYGDDDGLESLYND